MSENIAAAFVQQAARSPDRPALRWDDGEWSFAALREATARRAAALRARGLRPGDCVALILSNGPEYLEIVLAVASAALVLVPLDPRLSASAIERRLAHAACRAVITPQGMEPSGEPRADPIDAWAVVYTSGSTGEPKGAVLSHRAKLLSAIIEAQQYGTTQESVVLINTPLFHAHALVHAFTALLRGGCVSIARQFDAEETVRTITEHGVTEVSMVPTMFREILDTRPDQAVLNRLRVARCTGAPMAPDLRAAVMERFGHCLHMLYGATEAGGISDLPPEDVPRKPGSVGRPFPGVDIQVRDRVVSARSPYQFSGYLGGAPHRSGEDWLALNDLGRVDEDGFLYLEGRTDDVILSGGENIDPAEVEGVLRQHPAVTDVAVMGLPDARWGQVVAAYIVLRPGQAMDVEAYVERRLARFQRPRRVVFVASIPHNAMGKVDRAALRRLA